MQYSTVQYSTVMYNTITPARSLTRLIFHHRKSISNHFLVNHKLSTGYAGFERNILWVIISQWIASMENSGLCFPICNFLPPPLVVLVLQERKNWRADNWPVFTQNIKIFFVLRNLVFFPAPLLPSLEWNYINPEIITKRSIVKYFTLSGFILSTNQPAIVRS